MILKFTGSEQKKKLFLIYWTQKNKIPTAMSNCKNKNKQGKKIIIE